VNRPERLHEIAGLTTTVVDAEDADTAVVLLHGYAMQPSDLAPFAHSLGVPARFFFPRGRFSSPAGGYAWWNVDEEARAASLQAGPRDLANQQPGGLGAARDDLDALLAAIAGQFAPRRTIVGGFSQGGMLACDFVLRGATPVDGLVLLSASRLAFDTWQPCHERLRELPVYCSHGESDSDLAFAAGVALRDFLMASGARVSWMPFATGHEIPLGVWRGLRKFLGALLR
jgi:phospholipase/carboxylesterase